MTGFNDIQNGFYNTLINGMGLSRETFQILQPSPPLLERDDVLWNYFNNIPPLSLTQNYIASGGNQFYSDYSGLLSYLQSVKNTVKEDIGDENYKNWMAYLTAIDLPPKANMLPDLFYNWAIINAPDVAAIGAADYGALLLDPIAAAILDISLYKQGKKAPDWNIGYRDLKTLLSAAPAMSFTMRSASMSTDVKNTWTGGAHKGFFGLWSGSDSTSTISGKFASDHLEVAAEFAHVLTFTATPLSWYSSGAMGRAYNNPTTPPWRDVKNWTSTFDPATGNMTRFATSLIVVEQMNVTVNSEASFTSNEQESIQHNSSAGMWPFYTSNSGSATATSITFDKNGMMSINISSAANFPIVIGCNVLPANRYVGHIAAALDRAKELQTV